MLLSPEEAHGIHREKAMMRGNDLRTVSSARVTRGQGAPL